MFGKLFSSKENNIEVPEESEQLILTSLQAYSSDVFPKGIMPIAENVKISKHNNEITVSLTLPFPCQSELDVLASTLSDSTGNLVNFDVTLNIVKVREHAIKNIGNVIAVASGKGGVGKSTTAVNLAYALQAEGARVGILDADIYGPSIPTMLGVRKERPTSDDGKTMIPIQAQGLAAMSIGFLVEEDDATVWRGPMASSAFSQLLNETAWPELDYLIIDMPPGTGDIQLTLAQKVPVAAAVIVTTPQNVALADAVKGIAMFDKVQVPVLGVIENMSYHVCDNCGHHSHIFGQKGGERIADKFETRLLGQLPLNVDIRMASDDGSIDLLENSTGEVANLYRRIARNTAAQLFMQLDNRSPLTAKVTTSDE